MTLAREISKKFNSEASFLPLAQESVTPNQLADFLKGNVEVSFKSEAFSGNLAIDPVLLVQAYIDKFFSRGAALVVVETFTPQPQAGGAEWYIMNVSLVARGSKLFDPALERSELIRQLSRFFAAQIHENGTNCARTLCAAELPSSSEDLRTFAHSLDSLRYGRNAGVCEDIADVGACRRLVKTELAKITSRDKDSAMAPFGLVLAELSELRDLIRNGGSSDEIAACLDRVYGRLNQTKSRSGYFEALFKSDDRVQKFLKSSGLEDLGLRASFLSTYAHFIAGREYLHKGQSELAIEEYDRVTDVPVWFAGFVGAFRDFARIDAQPQDKELALEILDNYRQQPIRFAPYLQHAVIGKIAQAVIERFGKSLSADELKTVRQTALEAWDRALIAPSHHDQVAARAERARTLLAIQEGDRAAQEIEVVERELAGKVDVAYRMAFMSTAAYFTRTGDFAKARTYAGNAISAYEKNLCYVEKSPEFEALRTNDREKYVLWINELRRKRSSQC